MTKKREYDIITLKRQDIVAVYKVLLFALSDRRRCPFAKIKSICAESYRITDSSWHTAFASKRICPPCFMEYREIRDYDVEREMIV